MRTMMSLRVSICTIAVLLTLVSWSLAQPVASERLLGDLDMADNDGSVERAFFDYLFAKQLAQRIRNQLDVGDLQRKRSYWKQCAFNAVSCFGK